MFTDKNAIIINQFIPATVIHHNHQPKWFNLNIQHHIKCLKRTVTSILLINNNKTKFAAFETLLQTKIS